LRSGFWWGCQGGRDHLEDPGIDGRIKLRCICRKWDVGGGMGWIDVAQGRDRWRTLVNEVLKLMFIGPCIIAIVEE